MKPDPPELVVLGLGKEVLGVGEEVASPPGPMESRPVRQRHCYGDSPYAVGNSVSRAALSRGNRDQPKNGPQRELRIPSLPNHRRHGYSCPREARQSDFHPERAQEVSVVRWG
jgi:hypothetical protein